MPTPARPHLSEIERAQDVLADVIAHPQLVPLHPDGAAQGIWLMPEIHQPIGSFKLRGIFHAVQQLTAERRAAGLSTVSAGNTAQALAWTGRHFGVTARSLMPEHAPATKIDAVRAYGGEPVLVPVEEVFRFLREHGWESEPYAFVHPWTNRDVMIGHGTLGLEILDALPEVDSVFVPVGGGGLLGGVGSALKLRSPDVRVYAVEPTSCAALHASITAGRATQVDCKTMCDGVAVPYMTDEMYPILSELADEVILVEEAEVRSAIRRLASGNHIIAEGAGALATAAALKVPREQRGTSVCLVTGGSIDVDKLVAVLSEQPG